MRNIRDINSEKMLTLTSICRQYFGMKTSSLTKYEYFQEVPHIKIGRRDYWQKKDVDKYLERNKQ
ncbi:hypothetical protein X291_01635 [Oenococcus oeni IOEB_C23]|nr:hypothetical protein X291_01635 [Oenococcus oeni IOEB_C23]